MLTYISRLHCAQGVLRTRPFATPQRSLPDVAIFSACEIYVFHVYEHKIFKRRMSEHQS